MQELPTISFMGAVTELRSVIVVIQNLDKSAAIALKERTIFNGHIGRLIEALNKVGARSALASANRLQVNLENGDLPVTYDQLSTNLNDIESRFADHLMTSASSFCSSRKRRYSNRQTPYLVLVMDRCMGSVAHFQMRRLRLKKRQSALHSVDIRQRSSTVCER